MELKTQQEWAEHLNHTVLWSEDYKKNIWFEEKITREEYEKRN